MKRVRKKLTCAKAEEELTKKTTETFNKKAMTPLMIRTK